MKKQKVFVVGGPTAGGKTAFAIRLAEQLNGVIVNGDAIQVYRDLQILSARPSEQEQRQIPHYLFGQVDAWTNYSLADWLSEIKQTVPDLKNPIIVGGTGMYLDALINGIHEIPEVDPMIRQQVRQMPLDEVKAKVKDYPLSDPQRLRRALEIQLTTGKSITDFYSQPKKKILDADFSLFYILPDRAKVYQSCADRFEEMKKAGAVQEVARLNEIKATGGVLKAIGVKEIKSFLNHEIDEQIMTEQVITATRQYAKRQMTWFRHHGTPKQVITDPKNIKIQEITK